MNTFTINDIRGWNPCYDPARFLPEGWRGTALDILDCEDCPAVDRLWVVIRNECIDARTLRLFAVWCSRQALALIDPDPRSVAAVDTAERFAVGEATVDELAAAGAAAWAASASATAAAWYAASASANVAARVAARDAASGAAVDAARDAARAAQVGHLHEMLLVTDAARF